MAEEAAGMKRGTGLQVDPIPLPPWPLRHPQRLSFPRPLLPELTGGLRLFGTMYGAPSLHRP